MTVTSDAGDGSASEASIKNDGGDGATACNYAPPNNDARCPSSYSYSYQGQPCPAVGLSCAYPGAGDGMANGCFATAMMWCHGDGGISDLDGASDAGPGVWTVAQ